MIDYANWLRRAEDFVRGLDHLSGRLSVSIAVEPPLPEESADELSENLPLGLPACLYDLYAKGSASFCCTYCWKPNETNLRLIERLMPHTPSIYGGPRFVPAVKLEDAQYAVRSWARPWDAQVFQPPKPGWEVWDQCVPFVDYNTGDFLALKISDDGAQQSVVYLSHEFDVAQEPNVFEVSPSFERFLADWETLWYLWPAGWGWSQAGFDDLVRRGPLQPDDPKIAMWRRIIGAE